MDFDDSPEEAAYRARVRAFLASHAPAASEPPGGDGSEAAKMQRARAWQARKASAGYVGITWPRELGGQGGTPMQQVIFEQEQARYRVFITPFQVGMGMCLPTVYGHAEPELARRFVEPALRGEEIWCQLFSEPAAGSDLAGVRTRADRQGDGWIISGQKVWTSYANHSDYGLLLARTDADVPKHKGLTMFWVPMRAPGIEIRPIRSMTGHTDFNEVFLNEVPVPDRQRLGAVGAGWKVALTTLMHERLAIGKPADAPGARELLALAGSLPCGSGAHLDRGAVNEAIAKLYVNDAGLDFLRMRALTTLSRGEAPGPEASIGKLIMAKTRQEAGAAAMELLEGGALATEGQPALERFRYHYLFAPGLRIAGGTDEILRTIIAERVLGLPPDLRVDREVPFRSLA